MIRDEFNKIEISNDKQLLRVEFGKTQKVEFSSQKENETPEGDLNEKYVGKTIKKVTEVNVDYIQKIPTHTTATVVTSAATTATSAAAAAASTVVAASSVAVVAIATVTGITVGLHDYRCELTSLLISSNEISYSFTVVDQKRDDGQNYQSFNDIPEPRYQINRTAANVDPTSEEPTSEEPTSEEPTEEEPNDDVSDSDGIFNTDRPFVLKVSNGSYESEHYLGYGSSGRNTFYGLTLGDTYSIVLSENRADGEILYNESFTTVENSYVRDVYVSGAANYRQGTFEVYLDYIDELEMLSDFNLVLTEKDNSENNYVFPLENYSGSQDVSIDSLKQADARFDFEKEYTYMLSYQKNEDVLEFSGGDVKFYNTSTDVSEVFGVSWDKKANFLTNQTTIALDYRDDLNIFSNFRFVLMQEEPISADSPDPLVYSLNKTTEPQTITLTSNQMFSYSYTYSYMFTYDQAGEEVEQIIDSDSGLHFEDNSGTVVNGVSWDKTINLLTKQFTVTLDYQDDDTYNRFSDFQLTLKDSEMPEEMYDEPYDLVKTTDPQTVTIVEDSNLRLRKEMSYSFTYFDKLDNSVHTLEEGTVTFTDTSNGQKQFNGITINPTPNMTNNTIEVQLDYVDDFSELYGFTLNLYVGEETPTSIYLEDTTEKQNVDVSNYNIDFTKTYNYFVTYYDDAIWDEVSPDVGKGTITFDHSVFNGFSFNKVANFDTKEFTVQLDFVDDLNCFSEFELVVRDDYQHEKTFTLLKTTDVQTLDLADTETHTEDDETWESEVYSLRASTFTYVFSYYDASISDYVSDVSDPFTFENSLTSTFTDVISPFDFTPEEGNQSFLLPLRLVFDDAARVYESFDVQIFKGEDSVGSLRFEGSTKTKDWLLGVYVPDGGDINDIINADDTSIRVFAFVNSDENPNIDESEFEDPIYSEEVTFTLGQDHQIYGGGMTYEYIMYNMDLGFQLIYSGQPENFTDCELVLESLESGNIYRFSISELAPALNYSTIYMDSDIIGDTISEYDFQQDFIEHPMKISITYYTLTEAITSGDMTGGNVTQVKDGPFTTVLHETFQFHESV